MSDEYLIVHEDDGSNVDCAASIADISRDVRSWWNFLRMLKGGPPALMTVQFSNGRTEKIKVLRYDSSRKRPKFAELP